MNQHTKLGLTIFVTVTLFLIALIFELLFKNGRRFLALIICSTMALVMILTINFAVGKDDGRYANSKLKSWFDSLQSGKGPCCSDADGNVLQDADWESRAGHYRVKIEGDWYDVPDDAVLTQPNLYKKTVVWPIYYRTMGKLDRIEIRCFIPGSMT